MRGEGNPFGKGFSLSPHAPLSLPKTFVPVSGRWCSATGGRRCPVPRMAWEGGKFCLGMQKAPGHFDRALFAVTGPGAGRVFSTGCHIVPFGQSWSVDDPRDRMARGVLSPARTVRREEPGQFLAGLLASGGPASEDGDLHADQKKRFWKGGGKADQGRPSGPCPLRRRKVRASRAGWRENLFSKRFPSPVALLAHSTAGPDRCRAGRLRDRRPDGRGRLRQRPCR